MNRHDPSTPHRIDLQNDLWAKSMGIQYLEVHPGYCRVGLQLQSHMVNAAGYPHGGVIFSLADTAFATACNSYGVFDSVGLNVSISYLAAVAPDARLIAEAHEHKRSRRTGFYEVKISTDDGTLVALAQCISHRLAENRVRHYES